MCEWRGWPQVACTCCCRQCGHDTLSLSPPPQIAPFRLQSLTLDGVKFMLYPAGHVLGAAMVMLEIAGSRVEEDRHLMAAETPVDSPPDVLIVESTFGVQTHKSRETREALFTGGMAVPGSGCW